MRGWFLNRLPVAPETCQTQAEVLLPSSVLLSFVADVS